MIVPDELHRLVEINDFESRLLITRYTECSPSKIPTNVTDNLLVIVLKGKKKIVCGDYATVLSKGEFGLFRKGNYIMNQILSDDIYESLLIFIPNDYLQEIKQLYDKKLIYKCQAANQIPYVHGIAGTYMQHEAEQIAELLKDTIGDQVKLTKKTLK